ncbi:MAG TPA: rod shape-determining protein MreD [Sphingomicrobium sp.]|jgi:rod shape-determining protein MreD
MVRAALSPPRRIGQGPRPLAAYVPAITVVVAILLSAMPIVSTSGWFPDFGYLVFISWRLLRADPWPAWWAAPLGFVNDLFTAYPIGFSIALWSATMLALDLIDRRTMWRDYWIEWVLATVLIAIDECLQWRVAKVLGAEPPFARMIPALVISVCLFPVFAWLVSRIDRWRLGR